MEITPRQAKIDAILRVHRMASVNYGYKRVEYTRLEFTIWMRTNGYRDLYKAWVDSGYIRGLEPVVTRVDRKIPFRLDNIELNTREQFLKGREEQ